MLNFVVATQSEAEPVIGALKLKHTAASFPLFRKEGTCLTVSGIGKRRAAAACAWLAASLAKSEITRARAADCWINFGIAGHPDAKLGSSYSAHKITDHHSYDVWYPPQIQATLPTCDLTTVDKPLDHYLPGQLHDMEASGFVDTARIFTTAELVQCIKVVSDNNDNPLSMVTADTARIFIGDNLPSIISMADHLTDLSNSLAPQNSELLDQYCKQWNFSVSQTVKLDRLLQRHCIMHGTTTAMPKNLQSITSAKEVLRWLESTLQNTDYTS